MHFFQIMLLFITLTQAIQDTKYVFQHLESCNIKVQRSDSKMKLSYIALLPGVQLKKTPRNKGRSAATRIKSKFPV